MIAGRWLSCNPRCNKGTSVVLREREGLALSRRTFDGRQDRRPARSLCNRTFRRTVVVDRIGGVDDFGQ